ncbi:MAG TPA: hypothetical protein VGL09_07630 [Methylomirabilota bacterium]
MTPAIVLPCPPFSPDTPCEPAPPAPPGNATAKGAGAKVTTLEEGVIAGGDGDVGKVATEFIKAIARHRAWSREAKGQRVPV